jgi:[protein-PII] uridylyltransferase
VIFVCTFRRRHSFARATAALDQMGLTILDARITPTLDGASVDSYLVLEDNGLPIADRDRLADIELRLVRVLSERGTPAPTVTRRASRASRVFTTSTQVTLSADTGNRRTILELVAADRPGLLSEIGQVLWQEHVDLHGAKIMTVGERAEDVFYVADESGQPLDESQSTRLAEALTRALDRRDAAA